MTDQLLEQLATHTHYSTEGHNTRDTNSKNFYANIYSCTGAIVSQRHIAIICHNMGYETVVDQRSKYLLWLKGDACALQHCVN